MPTKRIDPPEGKRPATPCFDRDHSPPTMQCFPPGTYEHTCPTCGAKVTFTVPAIVCQVQQ